MNWISIEQRRADRRPARRQRATSQGDGQESVHSIDRGSFIFNSTADELRSSQRLIKGDCFSGMKGIYGSSNAGLML
jgi:hypothetical protein